MQGCMPTATTETSDRSMDRSHQGRLARQKTGDEATKPHPRTIGRREKTHRRIHAIVHTMPTEGNVYNSTLSLYVQSGHFSRRAHIVSTSILPSTPICVGEAGDQPVRRPRTQPAARH